MTCGSSNCGGHGTCTSISSMFQFYAKSSATTFLGWEGDHVTGCICDIGTRLVDCNIIADIKLFHIRFYGSGL